MSAQSIILIVLALPLFFAPAIIRQLPSTYKHITHLLRTAKQDDVELSFTPSERFSSPLIVIFSMILLGLKHLGFGRDIGKIQADGTVQLPALVITAPIKITEDDIKEYHHAAAPKSRDPSTATPLLLLAPLTTPLIPSLLLLRSNPIKPLGSVNVRNVFMFHRPDALSRLGSPEDAAMKAEARMGGGGLLGRRGKRGVEFDTVITVHADQEAAPIFSFTFTTLALLRLPSSAPHYPPKPTFSDPEPTWHADPYPLSLPTSSTPLPWAALSKDYNPIHLSPFLARLFGFKRSIAHGNMVLAMIMHRAVSGWEKLGDGDHPITELGRLWSGSASTPSWLVVEFKRPVFVPSAPRIRWAKGRVQVYEEPGRGSDSKAEVDVRVLVDIRAGEGDKPPIL